MTIKDEIRHDREAQRFTLPAAGDEAVLQYRIMGDMGDMSQPATVDFTHTYVPPKLRGQGLAEALVRHGLAWAKQQGLHIQASCWYVGKFLR